MSICIDSDTPAVGFDVTQPRCSVEIYWHNVYLNNDRKVFSSWGMSLVNHLGLSNMRLPLPEVG